MKGYVQIYTGDGKGKTTAALGLALRAAGAGLRVLIIQFLKQGDYSEIRAIGRLAAAGGDGESGEARGRILVEQHGLSRFVRGRPEPADIAAAGHGLDRARAALAGGECDVLILDEGNVAAAMGLFPVQALLDILREKPEGAEIVITGRNAPEPLLAAADLVTEMRAVRHYYQKGVGARRGIEK